MSYQLLATKRKFQRLLDQIADPSPATASQSSFNGGRDATPAGSRTSGERDELEPSTKRRRLHQETDKPTLRERSNVIRSSPHLALLLAQQARIRRQDNKAKTTEKLEKQSLAGYQPTSRTALLDRLKSFNNVLNWSNKPPTINEVQWARRGWRLDTFETVYCEVCQARAVVDLRSSKTNSSTQEATALEDFVALENGEDDFDPDDSYQSDLAKSYEKLIVEAHTEGCPWRHLGCNASVYSVQIFPAWNSAKLLAERYRHFFDSPDIIPQIIDSQATNVDIRTTFHALRCLFPDLDQGIPEVTDGSPRHEEVDHQNDPQLRAVALALSGWDIADQSKEIGLRFIECQACFRRVAPWLLRSWRFEDSDEGEPKSFSIMSEHREHCPWQNPAAQNPESTKPFEKKTATEQLADGVLVLALSRLQHIGDDLSYAESILPVGHPSRLVVEQLGAKLNRKQHGERSLSQQGLTMSNSKADEERQQKLKGLWKFLHRFKDLGRG